MIQLKRYDEAIAALDQALALEPKSAPAWTNKGGALFERGRHDEAVSAFDRALKIDPTFAKAWVNKGIALYTLERYEQAVAAYDRALALNPMDPIVSEYRAASRHRLALARERSMPRKLWTWVSQVFARRRRGRY